jgi:hypothetical protein
MISEQDWREPYLDAVALVRAAILYDHEGKQVLLAYGEPDLVIWTGWQPTARTRRKSFVSERSYPNDSHRLTA